MPDTHSAMDAEFAAIQTLYDALESLDDDARSRVVSYIIDRLEITIRGASRPGSTIAAGADADEEAVLADREGAAPKFTSFAELYDAAKPKANHDKALAAGYWLQVCQSAESFDGFSANNELKHLGQGLQNITNAINNLKAQKPALALQLKKSGKSQQARKVYKITVSGIKAVENMING